MENEDFSEGLINPFGFLEAEEVQKHFADLNIELLRGRHIQKDDYYLFQLSGTYYKELQFYYRVLYRLEFIKDRMDNEFYFYLQPPEEGKGEIADQSRHRELTEENTVIGIMLLSMYYDRYFTSPKEISWEDIQKEIQESDNKSLYKSLLFNDIRNDYSDTEWENVKKIFRRSLREFDSLGWVKRQSAEDGEKINFMIKESIHRLAKLYHEEINNFDQFSESYSLNKS
jgi:hypothetical protein